MDIYVYYSIRTDDAALARQRVDTLQQRLNAGYDIRSRLRRQPEEKNGLQTWMEIYLAVPAGFEDVIERAAAEEGVTAMAQGSRHVEQFVEVTTCA
ncbi:MAG: hypothetical protein ACI9ZF_001127 [Bradyrhizobium sp.]|jgi:hypothetical protein